MNAAETKLVAALRSGKYDQGPARLIRVKGNNVWHCCLGVACELSPHTERRDTGGHAGWGFAVGDTLDFYTLPYLVRRDLGWSFASGKLSITERYDNIVTLTDLNDSNFTFDQIADVIEAGLVERA